MRKYITHYLLSHSTQKVVLEVAKFQERTFFSVILNAHCILMEIFTHCTEKSLYPQYQEAPKSDFTS